MNDVNAKQEVEGEQIEFKPLTREQAKEWRRRQPSFSVWRLVAWQALAGCLATLLVWVVSQDASSAQSAAWGVLCVVVPAALFARGVTRFKGSPAGALASLFAWEAAKIAMTLVMLGIALLWFQSLSWLALLAAMMVTMKTYWFVLLVRPSVRKTID